MDQPARNAPCHCGSGRKYKRCCHRKDRAREAAASIPLDALGDEAWQAVESAAHWEADVVPLPIAFKKERAARPGCFLVAGAGYVLAHEVLARPPAETDELAHLLAERLAPLFERIGGERTVVVRHRAVADALRPLLEPEGARVEAAGRLADLEAAADSLVRHLTGQSIRPEHAASPDSWAGWGVEEPRIAALFSAMSELWRTAPWRHVSSQRALFARVPEGGDWALSVMGSVGHDHGFALYSEPADLRRLLDGARPVTGLGHIEGRVYSVSLEGRGRLPMSMQREVQVAGWEVADPRAYPFLMALNTPGGGVARRDWDDLVAVARGLAEATRRLGPALGGREAFAYRDPASGVSLKGSGQYHNPEGDAAPHGGSFSWRR